MGMGLLFSVIQCFKISGDGWLTLNVIKTLLNWQILSYVKCYLNKNVLKSKQVSGI